MRFIVLGDLHFAEYHQPELTEARNRLFRAFFAQIAALKPDIVFALGDTVNYGTLAELTNLYRLVAATDLPFIAVTGNHDLASLEKAEVAPFFLGGRTPASVNELYTAFNFEQVRFILLDTSRIKLSDLDWSGYVSEEQVEWLRAEIARFNTIATHQYLIVLGHHPIFGTTERSTEEMLSIFNSAEVYESFATLSGTLGIYFCGHNHAHSIIGPDALGWYFVQTAAPLDCRSFRLVTVTENRVEIETLDFDLSDPTLRQAFELARTGIESSFEPQEHAVVYGTFLDRSLTIKREMEVPASL
ncbi:MAG: metallophosphoesterase [Chloroflexota bacterium]|nr:metallophosphoesterase [Chloroflexota bacterium]